MSTYHNWQTRIEEGQVLHPQLKALPLKQQLQGHASMLAGMEDSHGLRAEFVRLLEEYVWLRAGKPYYKIHPKLVSRLCRCDLAKIPASYFEVPGRSAALIRFCQAHPGLTVEGNEYVRCILITRSMSRLSATELSDVVEHGQVPEDLAAVASTLTLRIDLGDRGECGNLSYIREWVVSINLLPDRSLDEEFAAYEDVAPERIAPGTRRREVLTNCLRLIATVGLIGNSPEDNLLEYDVLSKDRAAFAIGDADRRKTLIERARRRGKIGWNVGTNELFIGETACWSASHASEGRWEHSHAHIRTGHLHAVRCGPGRQEIKIKWFRPTVVRADLPFLAG